MLKKKQKLKFRITYGGRFLLGAILKYEYNAKSMLELNQNIWA